MMFAWPFLCCRPFLMCSQRFGGRVSGNLQQGPNGHKIAIIGFGSMGAAIAAELLRRGCSVRVLDECRLRLKSAHQILRSTFGPCFSPSTLDSVMKRFSVADDLEQLLSDEFHLVVEAVDETLSVKRELFQQVAAFFKHKGVPPDDVLLCSNSMNLPICMVASDVALDFRHRCIGLRFLDGVLFVDKVAVTFLDPHHAVAFAGHIQHVLHSLKLKQMDHNKSRGPRVGMRNRRLQSMSFAARSAPREQQQSPSNGVAERCGESACTWVQLHVVQHPIPTSNVSASGYLGTQTGYCFYGHFLTVNDFLALETTGAIFAGRQRSEKIACEKVVLSDGGGVLRAQKGGTDECIVVGRCVQHCEAQPCTHYVLDIKSMLNSHGLWGLVAFTAQESMETPLQPMAVQQRSRLSGHTCIS